MNQFKKRWNITSNWQVVVILVVFAITGSTAAYIGKPILTYFNITQDNLHSMIYWSIRILILFIVYQFMLVFFGWVFGQFQFFWNFEKKMLCRIGLKRFFDNA